MPRWQLWIAARQEEIQSCRRMLESHAALDRSKKIRKLGEGHVDNCSFSSYSTSSLPSNITSAIPTTTYLDSKGVPDFTDGIPPSFKDYGLENLANNGRIFYLATEVDDLPGPVVSHQAHSSSRKQSNPVAATLLKWLSSFPPETQDGLPCSLSDIALSESWSHQIYPPLLLLGPSAFKSPAWHTALAGPLAGRVPELYEMLCAEMGLTHVAINAPIPPTKAPSTASNGLEAREGHVANTLRSPSALQPLYGAFGSPADKPDEAGFSRALWATARQNGLWQVFAPLHTMFSRGNVKEKARVLGFPGLKGAEVTAVDLYAGIGYFAFSYAKAGAKCVLCWEINPWSVEGMRRGAKKNGWNVRILRGEGEGIGMEKLLGKEDEGETMPRLVMFEESNELAALRVEALRGKLPPVRHVNCGYLPSSETSWRTAVECLDPQEGGWVHAHENVAAAAIEIRLEEVEVIFNKLVRERLVWQDAEVKCEHVERVKSYAPGVMHCVFDISIHPPIYPV